MKLFLLKILFNLSKDTKTDISEFSELRNDIWSVAKDNLYVGFILSAFEFKTDDPLFTKLTKLNNNYIERSKYLMHDLKNISSILNSREINHVTLKGTAINILAIYDKNIRNTRDIDILVEEKYINDVYKILRLLGYKYYYQDVSDSSKYLYMHHLPPLVNENGTTVELHTRITDVTLFKNCPLKDYFFKNKQITEQDSLSVPSNKSLQIHALYHGIIHHQNNNKLGMLLDLWYLSKEEAFFDGEDLEVLSNLGLLNQYIELNKVLDIINISEGFGEVQDVLNLDDLFKEYEHKSIKIYDRLKWKLKFISHRHQVSFFSFAFLKFFLKNIHEYFFKVKS